MAKRFTDTDKWRKKWFMDLSMKHKLFWFYLLDNCDNAGIYDVNLSLASFIIGEEITIKDIDYLNGNVFVLSSDKWFIKKFIEFQYGLLNPSVNPHKPVISKLKKYSVLKGYLKGIYTLKDKEQDKDKDKEQNKDENFNIFWSVYPKKKSKGIAEKTWVKLKKSKELPEIDIIINAVKIQKESFDWKKEAGQFIPHPSTWLNAKGWENEENKISEQKRDLMAEAFSRKG